MYMNPAVKIQKRILLDVFLRLSNALKQNYNFLVRIFWPKAI